MSKNIQTKTDEQYNNELAEALSAFDEAYPDIYKFSSDREVSACILSILDKYKKVFPESKPPKKEHIIKSVKILTEFVKRYKPHIAYSIFSDKDYLRQRKMLFKKAEKILKKELGDFKKAQTDNSIDNIMSK